MAARDLDANRNKRGAQKHDERLLKPRSRPQIKQS
jgi:hypothetical protein